MPIAIGAVFAFREEIHAGGSVAYRMPRQELLDERLARGRTRFQRDTAQCEYDENPNSSADLFQDDGPARGIARRRKDRTTPVRHQTMCSAPFNRDDVNGVP